MQIIIMQKLIKFLYKGAHALNKSLNIIRGEVNFHRKNKLGYEKSQNIADQNFYYYFKV